MLIAAGTGIYTRAVQNAAVGNQKKRTLILERHGFFVCDVGHPAALRILYGDIRTKRLSIRNIHKLQHAYICIYRARVT